VKDVGAAQRNEPAQQGAQDREHGVAAELRLKVMVFPSPGEPGEWCTGQQHALVDREHHERGAADDRDDLGHANTVAVANWGFGTTGEWMTGNTGFVSGMDDEEALTWAGGRDPSHYETPEAKPPRSSKQSRKVAGAGAGPGIDDGAGGPESSDVDDEDDARPATSSAVLVSLGILGGIYLLYTVGWFVSWQRFTYVAASPLDEIAFSVQQALSLVAAPLWFIVVLVLTRDRKPTARLVWLLVGALVLVPWPFTLGV